MKKMMFLVVGVLAVTVAVPAFAGGGGGSTGSSASVGQNQWQWYDGTAVVTPHWGITEHGGYQWEIAYGTSYGPGSVVSSQTESQFHTYGGADSHWDSLTSHLGFSYMEVGMEGKISGSGEFDGDNWNSYDSVINSINFGPNLALSSAEDGFEMDVYGRTSGRANFRSYTGLETGNSYANTSWRGDDYVSHTGENSSSVLMRGKARNNSSYEGHMSGYQTGGSFTSQDGNGTYQFGSQLANAELKFNGFGSRGARVSYNGTLSQSHSYEALNQGPNGWQYSTGTVTTTVNIRGGV